MSPLKPWMGGAIAMVREGDAIEIDVENRKLTLDVDEREMERRTHVWHVPEPKVTRGCLSRYAILATSASTGAILKSRL